MDWDLTEKVLKNLAYIVGMGVGIITAKKNLNDMKDRKEKKKEEKGRRNRKTPSPQD
nr:hypothetical protein [Bacillus thuringiensis]